MDILVTRPTNVTLNEDGTFELKNEKIIGHLRKTHAISAQVADPESGHIQIGVIMKGEVYWENQRSPAFTMESPEDIVWLTMEQDEIEEAEEAHDSDTTGYEDVSDSYDDSEESLEDDNYF